MASGGAILVMALFTVSFRMTSQRVVYVSGKNDAFMHYLRNGKEIFHILRSIADFLALLLLVQGIEPNPGPMSDGSAVNKALSKKRQPNTDPGRQRMEVPAEEEDPTHTSQTSVETTHAAAESAAQRSTSLATQDEPCTLDKVQIVKLQTRADHLSMRTVPAPRQDASYTDMSSRSISSAHEACSRDVGDDDDNVDSDWDEETARRSDGAHKAFPGMDKDDLEAIFGRTSSRKPAQGPSMDDDFCMNADTDSESVDGDKEEEADLEVDENTDNPQSVTENGDDQTCAAQKCLSLATSFEPRTLDKDQIVDLQTYADHLEIPTVPAPRQDVTCTDTSHRSVSSAHDARSRDVGDEDDSVDSDWDKDTASRTVDVHKAYPGIDKDDLEAIFGRSSSKQSAQGPSMDDDFCANSSSDTDPVDDIRDDRTDMSKEDNAEKLPSGAENGANGTSFSSAREACSPRGVGDDDVSVDSDWDVDTASRSDGAHKAFPGIDKDDLDAIFGRDISRQSAHGPSMDDDFCANFSSEDEPADDDKADEAGHAQDDHDEKLPSSHEIKIDALSTSAHEAYSEAMDGDNADVDSDWDDDIPDYSPRPIARSTPFFLTNLDDEEIDTMFGPGTATQSAQGPAMDDDFSINSDTDMKYANGDMKEEIGAADNENLENLSTCEKTKTNEISPVLNVSTQDVVDDEDNTGCDWDDDTPDISANDDEKHTDQEAVSADDADISDDEKIGSLPLDAESGEDKMHGSAARNCVTHATSEVRNAIDDDHKEDVQTAIPQLGDVSGSAIEKNGINPAICSRSASSVHDACSEAANDSDEHSFCDWDEESANDSDNHDICDWDEDTASSKDDIVLTNDVNDNVDDADDKKVEHLSQRDEIVAAKVQSSTERPHERLPVSNPDTPSVNEKETTVDVQTPAEHLNDLHESDAEHDGTNIVRNFNSFSSEHGTQADGNDNADVDISDWDDDTSSNVPCERIVHVNNAGVGEEQTNDSNDKDKQHLSSGNKTEKDKITSLSVHDACTPVVDGGDDDVLSFCADGISSSIASEHVIHSDNVVVRDTTTSKGDDINIKQLSSAVDQIDTDIKNGTLLEHIACSQDLEDVTNSDWDDDTSSFLANERLANVDLEEVKADDAGINEDKNTDLAKEATNDLEDVSNSDWDNDTSSFLANERLANDNLEEVKADNAGINKDKDTDLTKSATNINMLERSSLEHVACSQDIEDVSNSDWDNDTSSFLANERLANDNLEETKADDAGIHDDNNIDLAKEPTKDLEDVSNGDWDNNTSSFLANERLANVDSKEVKADDVCLNEDKDTGLTKEATSTDIFKRSSLEHIACSQDLEDVSNSDWDNDTSSFLANERLANDNLEEVKADNAGIIKDKDTDLAKEATTDLEDVTNSDWDNDTSSFLANERLANDNLEEVKADNAGIIKDKDTDLAKEATTDLEDVTNSDWDNDTSSFLANERLANDDLEEIKPEDAGIIKDKNRNLAKETTNDLEDVTNSDWDNDTSSFLANERLASANLEEVKVDNAGVKKDKNTVVSNINMLERSGSKLPSPNEDCGPANDEEDKTDVGVSTEEDYYDDDGFMTDDDSIDSLPFDDDDNGGDIGVQDLHRNDAKKKTVTFASEDMVLYFDKNTTNLNWAEEDSFDNTPCDDISEDEVYMSDNESVEDLPIDGAGENTRLDDTLSVLQDEQDISPFAEAQDTTELKSPDHSYLECNSASLNVDMSAATTPVSLQDNSLCGNSATQVAMTTRDCRSADMDNIVDPKKKVRFAANYMVLYFDDSISHLSDSLSEDDTYGDEVLMSDEDSVESLPLDDECHLDEVCREDIVEPLNEDIQETIPLAKALDISSAESPEQLEAESLEMEMKFAPSSSESFTCGTAATNLENTTEEPQFKNMDNNEIEHASSNLDVEAAESGALSLETSPSPSEMSDIEFSDSDADGYLPVDTSTSLGRTCFVPKSEEENPDDPCDRAEQRTDVEYTSKGSHRSNDIQDDSYTENLNVESPAAHEEVIDDAFSLSLLEIQGYEPTVLSHDIDVTESTLHVRRKATLMVDLEITEAAPSCSSEVLDTGDLSSASPLQTHEPEVSAASLNMLGKSVSASPVEKLTQEPSVSSLEVHSEIQPALPLELSDINITVMKKDRGAFSETNPLVNLSDVGQLSVFDDHAPPRPLNVSKQNTGETEANINDTETPAAHVEKPTNQYLASPAETFDNKLPTRACTNSTKKCWSNDGADPSRADSKQVTTVSLQRKNKSKEANVSVSIENRTDGKLPKVQERKQRKAKKEKNEKEQKQIRSDDSNTLVKAASSFMTTNETISDYHQYLTTSDTGKHQSHESNSRKRKWQSRNKKKSNKNEKKKPNEIIKTSSSATTLGKGEKPDSEKDHSVTTSHSENQNSMKPNRKRKWQSMKKQKSEKLDRVNLAITTNGASRESQDSETTNAVTTENSLRKSMHPSKKYHRKQLKSLDTADGNNAGLSMFYQAELPSRSQKCEIRSDQICDLKRTDKSRIYVNPYSDIQPEYMSFFTTTKRPQNTKDEKRIPPSTKDSEIIRKLNVENKSVKSTNAETDDIKEKKSKITKFWRRFFK